MLTDAELLLGLSRHLSSYSASPAKAQLEQLEFSGQVFDLAFRLRSSGTSTPDRVRAIGFEASLGSRVLREVMAALEALEWVSVQRGPDGKTPVSVEELIPAPAILMQSASAVVNIAVISAVERATMRILRATTLVPRSVEEALKSGSQDVDSLGEAAGDEAAEEALRHLLSLRLARRVTAADGREVVYNANVWVGNGDEIARTALKVADAHATSEIAGLLEEVAGSPGIPESMVTSTQKRWIDFAVSQGLVQRSVIQTSSGHEQGFLFSPHLARDPFGNAATDASGQVKQLVGSMIYAATFAETKLISPPTFIRSLIRNGVAGHASAIGTDYPMLETAGIVRVVPGWQNGRYRLELLQADVAEDALKILSDRDETGADVHNLAAIRAQRSYVHVERERARLVTQAEGDDIEEARLVAALRDAATRRTYQKR